MKEFHIVFNTNGDTNAETLGCMIEELTQLGVYDTVRNVVVYDDNNKELSNKVQEIVDKYLHQ